MDIEKEKCRFCGKPAKVFQFAAFICDCDECVEKAKYERGGPAGHQKRKAEQQAGKH